MDIPIRSLRPEDAPAIASIASETASFTIPSPYIVWVLARTQDALCRVATDSAAGVTGYILALTTVDPAAVFVWQLAVRRTSPCAGPVLRALCLSLLQELKRRDVSRVLFTTIPGARSRLLTRILTGLGSPEVRRSAEVTFLSPNGLSETEYCAVVPLGSKP